MKRLHRCLSALLPPVLLAGLVACASTSNTTGSTGTSQAQAFQIAQGALLHALGDDFIYQDNLSVDTWSKDPTKWRVDWSGAPHANERGDGYTGWVIIDKTTGHVDNVQTAPGR